MNLSGALWKLSGKETQSDIILFIEQARDVKRKLVFCFLKLFISK